jgi:hypothetical protein
MFSLPNVPAFSVTRITMQPLFCSCNYGPGHDPVNSYSLQLSFLSTLGFCRNGKFVSDVMYGCNFDRCELEHGLVRECMSECFRRDD